MTRKKISKKERLVNREARRQKELARQRAAHEQKKQFNEAKKDNRQKTAKEIIGIKNARFRSEELTIEDLARKISRGVEIWSSVYQTKTGQVVPYLFLADQDLPNAGFYMDENHSEIYAMFEMAYSSWVAKYPNENIEFGIIGYTNPSDGNSLGICCWDREAFIDFARILGDDVAQGAADSFALSQIVSGMNVKNVFVI